MSDLRTAEYGAKRIGVDRQRFYELARRNVLPPGVVVRLGRQLRVNPQRLEEFIEAGGQTLPGGWRREAAEDSRQPA